MIRRTFKVGDTITISRTTNAGTGYHYALTRLTRRDSFGGRNRGGERKAYARRRDSAFLCIPISATRSCRGSVCLLP